MCSRRRIRRGRRRCRGRSRQRGKRGARRRRGGSRGGARCFSGPARCWARRTGATSIGGNLPTAPVIMGNTVVWKPAATAVLSNYFIMRLLAEAGLPTGVINFVPGPSVQVSERVLADRAFAGIHFTGSTEVFQALWKQAGGKLTSYAAYPRLVGETG